MPDLAQIGLTGLAVMGRTKPVTITIDPAATNHSFSVWDYCSQSFVIKPGEYTIYVGNAAGNTPHTATLAVASD
jgi:beta-glucosidase